MKQFANEITVVLAASAAYEPIIRSYKDTQGGISVRLGKEQKLKLIFKFAGVSNILLARKFDRFWMRGGCPPEKFNQLGI
jgi:hypothetical protein